MSVKRIGDGAYRIYVELGFDSNGKRIRRTQVYHATATGKKAADREAQDYARELEEKVKSGKYFDGETLTVSGAIQIWKTQWGEKNITQGTLESYMDLLRLYVPPTVGNMKIGKVTSFHIQQIIDDLEARTLAPAYIRRIFVAIQSVFKYAYLMRIIQEDPCDRVQLRKTKKTSAPELHYWTAEQATVFLDFLDSGTVSVLCQGHARKLSGTGKTYTVGAYREDREIHPQWKAYFSLAIFGGLRRGEEVALNWSDIDFQHNTVCITKALSKTKEGVITKGPKTASGVREITLPDVCMKALRKWKTEQMQICLKLGTAWKGLRGAEYDGNPVFIKDTGERMFVDTPTGKFESLLHMYNSSVAKSPEEELPVIRLHDLRHTSATLLLSSGADIETVSHRLGHSRASVTLDVYAHAMPQNDKKAAETLERAFES